MGILFAPFLHADVPNTEDLLREMDNVLRGKSHDMMTTLDVKTKSWERHYKIQVWMKGVDFTFARVLEPAKVKGQGFLRQQARLWNYLPSAERTILIPPSLMLDRFMGSDFSNDDFVKLSYLPRDYSGKILDEDPNDGETIYHLELMPHPDAPVTYGKLELWINVDSIPIKMDFYNERMELMRTLHYSDVKTFGDHKMPTVWRMENHLEKDRETIVTIEDATFDQDIPDSLFTRENLERANVSS